MELKSEPPFFWPGAGGGVGSRTLDFRSRSRLRDPGLPEPPKILAGSSTLQLYFFLFRENKLHNILKVVIGTKWVYVTASSTLQSILLKRKLDTMANAEELLEPWVLIPEPVSHSLLQLGELLLLLPRRNSSLLLPLLLLSHSTFWNNKKYEKR